MQSEQPKWLPRILFTQAKSIEQLLQSAEKPISNLDDLSKSIEYFFYARLIEKHGWNGQIQINQNV